MCIVNFNKVKMKNNLGKVIDALMVSSGRKVKNGTYITFETIVNVSIGNYVDIEFNNDMHHFEIMDISIKGENLLVDARESGYYARKFDNIKDFDLRKLIGSDIYLVDDVEQIKKIKEQSCWC